MMNGIDVSKVIPHSIGFVSEKGIILPCAVHAFVPGTLFYQTNPSSKIAPKMNYVLALGLVALALVGM